MRPVLTPEQARELDRASQERGIPAETLMELAGRAVARACLDLCGGSYGRRAVVVCGKGNNGGDGFVAARHLAGWGMRVAVVTVQDLGELGEHAATNAGRLRQTDIRIVDIGELERELARADVVVDAIFGTGFHGMPEDSAAAAIISMNAAGVPLVAVDIPSGVDGETGAIKGDAVLADLTVTFGAAKMGVVLLPGAAHAGTVRVVDIGFPEDLMRPDVFLTEPADVASILPVRPVDGHKRESVLLVVAGSRAMTGAPRLIAEAAARMGAGLVQVASPASALPAIQARLTEATFIPLAETSAGTLAAGGLDVVLEALDRATAVAIGPGLTTVDETSRVIREIVAASPVPSVIDADALNAYAGAAAGLADRRADAVLTPHAGEFSGLTGVKRGDLASDRLRHVRGLATTTRAVTLLKGSRTVIAEPDGRAWINVTGSAALATAGTGDVLTGMIGGLLARGLGAAEAAWTGVYLHGLAGTLAGREAGNGVVAGDLIPSIPRAVAHVEDHR